MRKNKDVSSFFLRYLKQKNVSSIIVQFVSVFQCRSSMEIGEVADDELFIEPRGIAWG